MNGFTLIELSIVLVIVGLLTAGILVGRALIHASEVRSQVAQIKKVEEAVLAFQAKYDCLPGDCAKATDFGFSGGTEDNGNGDGVLDELPERMVGNESVNFWSHLNKAGFIEGNFEPYSDTATSYIPGINSPELKLTGHGVLNGPANDTVNTRGGLWIIRHELFVDTVLPRAIHALFITTTTSDFQWFGAYPGSDAYALDAKMDDGYPLSGNIEVLAGFAAGPMTPFYYASAWPDACVDDRVTPAIYNISIKSTISSVCSPVIKTQF